MSQSLPPLPAAGPQRRKQIFLVMGVVIALVSTVMFGLWITDPKRKAKNITQAVAKSDRVVNYRTPGANLNPDEVWIEKSETRLREMDVRNRELENQIKALQDQVKRGVVAAVPPLTGSEPMPPVPGSSPAFPEASKPGAANSVALPVAAGTANENSPEAARRRPPLPPQPGLASRPGYPANPPPQPIGLANGTAGSQPTLSPSILSVRIGAEPTGKDNTKQDGMVSTQGPKLIAVATIQNTLPTGSFSKAVLLSGVDAPTGGLARTNPHPVLLRVMDNAQLPNHFRSRIRECFVTAAAYGDLSSERAYMRLEKLSCVLKSGEIVDTSIKGYVTGEDGKNGFRGRVVSKQGQLIGRALLAGVASGLGSSLSQSYGKLSTSPLGSVTTVDPKDVAKVGLANGVSNALEKIADFYIERANELYPIIEIDASRQGEVVLTDSVSLGEAFERAQRARENQGDTP